MLLWVSVAFLSGSNRLVPGELNLCLLLIACYIRQSRPLGVFSDYVTLK